MLTAAQIVTLACQEARVPGFTSQAGQLLNQILSELCQNFDFSVCRKIYNFNFNSTTGTGPGPYKLPQDYLRANNNDVFYTIFGVPYVMIPIDLSEYDRLVQTPGFADFPQSYATDLSGSGTPFSSGFSSGFGPVNPAPNMYVWPPASGAYPVTVRYQAMMPEITTPETSQQVPWFPQQTFLRRRLAGEIMGISDDERMASYLGDDEDRYPNGAGVILRRFLKMEGDKNTRAQTVQLDRRRFGSSFDRLRNTKLVGW